MAVRLVWQQLRSVVCGMAGRCLAAVSVIVACTSMSAQATDWQWKLPPGFPTPAVPPGNPMTLEKVVLGRYLFYDVRLSGNQTEACASCHRQALAFTDGLPVGIGSTGQHHPRNSMSLTNVAYAATLAWANPLLPTLEKQVLLPMFGDMPVELGLSSVQEELPGRFQSDGRYRRLFAEAFPDDDAPFSSDTFVANLVQGLTSFVRTLISGNAPYDRYTQGLDDNALSPSAQHGGQLFFSERLECFHCHVPFAFADSVTFAGNQFDNTPFHSNALYNIDGMGGYPPNNTGVFAITNMPEDMGAFKAVTLRNIALTAPYMHDGSIATLDGVLDHYAAGGRTILSGSYAGDGAKNPNKGGFIRGFTLTDQERRDVLNFLESLTDTEFVTNPRLSDPFATAACSGDCSLDGVVTPDELTTGVNVAGGSATLAHCVDADIDGDGVVQISELIAAVNRAVDGCSAPATVTATAAPTLTPTPLPSPIENLFGSTQMGGGTLTVDVAPTVNVSYSGCIGGTDATCNGGLVVYSGTQPAFKEATADEPDLPLFQLPNGILVSLEVIAIDPAVLLSFGATVLSAPGQSVVLGTTPGIEANLVWQVQVPAGGVGQEYSVMLKLTTTSPTYSESVPFTMMLTPSPGPAG